MERVEPIVFHVRLTKGCNADCSYCSSWELGANEIRLTPENFKKSLHYIYKTYTDMGLDFTHVSMQYLGGEVLIIPQQELLEIVTYARNFFREKGIDFKDGVQSNLIGSNSKTEFLFKLFEGRVGTSIDTYGTQRTVNGSHKKYKDILKKNEQNLKNNVFFKTKSLDKSIPAIFTMDNTTYKNALPEYREAIKNNRNLTLKSVFEGGRDVNNLNVSAYKNTLIEILEKWFMKENIVVEPFYGMLDNYLENAEPSKCTNSGCHFQNDCSKRSVALDPNGDIYVCQDMADMGKGLLGNAIEEKFDHKKWIEIDNRGKNLHNDCKQCEFLNSCRGGCMATTSSIESEFWGKAVECEAWMAIFNFYKNAEKKYNIDAIRRWHRRIGVKS